MDATSASGNGFDAALKALEDLETSVAQPRDEKPAAPAAAPVSAIAFSEADPESEPAAITAVPFEEVPLIVPDLDALVAEQSATPAVPAAPAAASPAPSRAVRFTVGLALVSSIISVAGLIVAERTIMSAQLVVADARERQHQLEQSNKLIRDLELIRDKQIELLQQQQVQLANPPVTAAEVQHKMDNLQAGLLARDPLNNVVDAIQAGQAENNARFAEFGMKMARVESAVGRK